MCALQAVSSDGAAFGHATRHTLDAPDWMDVVKVLQKAVENGIIDESESVGRIV